ncbi:MAG TPA: MauE/DoxX family redox-associated membrane protein [Dehalococcoidales bacterium]|nr:MauE/DoxX family redox-associated membrane protein [Dehalococcoidales bacterium]
MISTWFKQYRHWIGVWGILFLGLIFVAAGTGKMLLQSEVAELYIFPDFVPPAFIEAVYIWIPRVELIIGILLILGIAAKFVASLSSLLIAGFISNNSLLLKLGLGSNPCGCFGAAEGIAQERLSVIGALYLDGVMVFLVMVILFCYQRSFFNIYPWFIRRGKIAKEKDRSGSG